MQGLQPVVLQSELYVSYMLVLYLEYVEVVYMSVMLCDVIYMRFIIYVEYVEVVYM